MVGNSSELDWVRAYAMRELGGSQGKHEADKLLCGPAHWMVKGYRHGIKVDGWHGILVG